MHPYEMSVAQAVKDVHSGELSARVLVESCLKRIAELDASIRAWARLCPEQALREADRIDQTPVERKTRLPLAGVPFGVKDIFLTEGLETTAGSKILKGWVPTRDAVAVARLRRAGAILLGKTATTEFASSDPAPTRNPVDLRHTPGGSSAGSGAAVAAQMCPAALGSQTAGSILRPAAYCGAVGFKPTYGAVSREGVLPLAWTMDHVGPITRSVEDAALLFGQLVEPEGARPRPGTGVLRVGIPDRYFDSAVPEVTCAIARVCDSLPALGWRTAPISLPTSFELAMDGALVILQAEIAAAHEDWFRRSRDDYGPKLRGLVETGQKILASSYLRAQRIRRQATQEMSALFEHVDVLLTPTTPAPAPEGFATTGDASYCWPFSCFGMPSLTLPVPAEGTQLPVGLQLVGNHGSDWALLDAGRSLELHVSGAKTRA